MSAPEHQGGKVDPFIVAVDMVCLAGFLSVALAVLFGINFLIESLLARHPALVDFMMQRWVAPALVIAGIVVLTGIAVMLLVSGSRDDRAGGK